MIAIPYEFFHTHFQEGLNLEYTDYSDCQVAYFLPIKDSKIPNMMPM